MPRGHHMWAATTQFALATVAPDASCFPLVLTMRVNADERAEIQRVMDASHMAQCPLSPITMVPLASRQLLTNRYVHSASDGVTVRPRSYLDAVWLILCSLSYIPIIHWVRASNISSHASCHYSRLALDIIHHLGLQSAAGTGAAAASGQ